LGAKGSAPASTAIPGALIPALILSLAACLLDPPPPSPAGSPRSPEAAASPSPAGVAGILRLSVSTYDGQEAWMVARLPLGRDQSADSWNVVHWSDSATGAEVDFESSFLPPGAYLLHLFAGAHRDHLAEVSIEPGRVTELAITLAPMPLLVVEHVGGAGDGALSVADAVALPDGTAVSVRGELVLDPEAGDLPQLCDQTYLTPGSCVHPALPLEGLVLDDVPGIAPAPMIPGGFSAADVVVEGALRDPVP
jgi:hypothetical protein